MPTYILRDIPPDLWSMFRAALAADGKSLRSSMLALVQLYVDDFREREEERLKFASRLRP